MKKVLVAPGNYVVDCSSVSEFYYSGMLLRELALQNPTVEFHVVCGHCVDKQSMPTNLRWHEIYHNADMAITVGRRIHFYLHVFIRSLILALRYRFDMIWHMLPNGAVSFNPFILLGLDRLCGIQTRAIGRLAEAYGEEEPGTFAYTKGKVDVRKTGSSMLAGWLYRVLRRCSRAYFSRFDKFIFYNQAGIRYYDDLLPGVIDREKTRIVPVGYEPWGNGSASKVYAYPLRFLSVGNLITRKRTDRILDVCQRVRERGIDVGLDVVGDGYEKEALIELAAAKGLGDSVRFHGFVPKKDVVSFYERAHFVFLLSAKEAFGHVMLEAWSTDTIFVGSEIEAFREHIQSGRNGFLIDPEREASIERFIEDVCKLDQERFHEITACGRLGLTEFTWPRVAAEYARFLVHAEGSVECR